MGARDQLASVGGPETMARARALEFELESNKVDFLIQTIQPIQTLRTTGGNQRKVHLMASIQKRSSHIHDLVEVKKYNRSDKPEEATDYADLLSFY